MGFGSWISDRVSDVADAAGDVWDAGTEVVSNVWDAGTDMFNGAVDWIGDRVSDVASGVGDALSWLKDRALGWLDSLWNPFKWIFDAISWVFDALTSWFSSWWDAIKDLLRGIDAPRTLKATAEAWDQGPVAQLSGLEQTISSQSLLADEGWTGTAGQAYLATIPPQVSAVTAVRTLATNTSQALKDASNSLTTLYAEGGGIIGKVYAALNGAPGSLFSMEAVLEVVGLDLDNIFEVINAIKKFSEEMTEQKEKLAAMATENAAFPGGVWPKATTA